MAQTPAIDYSDPVVVRRIARSKPGRRGERNYDITRSYFAIGRRLRRRLGNEDADWPTTAAWASGAIGLIVRGDEDETSKLLWLAKSIAPKPYDDVLLEARRNLEEGNRQVYAELGVAFADLAEQFGDRANWSKSEEQDFLERLPVTSRSVPWEWQQLTSLRPAFELYFEAMKLDDGSGQARKRKSELIFAANVLVTVSEQAGLQPYLDAAFARVSRTVQDNPLGTIPVVRGAVQVVAYAVQALAQRLITEFAIKVPIGDEALGVGKPLRPRHGQMWAPNLRQLTEEAALQVWERHGRTGDDGRGSSTADWTVMRERVNYIAAFFRAWQQDERLRNEPKFLAGRADRSLGVDVLRPED